MTVAVCTALLEYMVQSDALIEYLNVLLECDISYAFCYLYMICISYITVQV